jgi:small basic protein
MLSSRLSFPTRTLEVANMKASKVAAVLWLLGVIIGFIYSFFHPRPYSPYSSFMMVMAVTVIALETLWPGFKAFSRALPLAFRLLLAGFLVFIVFMDIKTSGFTGYTISNLGWIAAWGWFLFSGK